MKLLWKLQLLLTTGPDGSEMIKLAPGEQPDRLDLLLTEHAAKVAQHGTLSAEPSTTITYAGTAYGFRIVRRDGVTELAAIAV
mgnify:CR=1 FL=1